MKRLFWTFTLVLLASELFAQIDNEFWFVAPEASINHGDDPILLRISTMESPAHITLRMPADLYFPPQSFLLSPNSTFTFDLTVPWKDTLENKPADMVLNKGILLISDSLVTAYYEINDQNNPCIFPLKGKNGLGTDFWIVGQNNYINHFNCGSEAFDIVATEDSTTITITPSIDIVGHLAGIPFQVKLNKGQTYSARTMNTTATATLAGSHVVSDKPVAITISDDSIETGGYDIIGDQLVPVNLLGWKYVVIKGYADNTPPNNDDERVYIVATRDNTDLFIDGNSTPAATLNTGQLYCYPFQSAANTAYFEATEPILVYHLSGNPGEAGASIIPQDSCTGSPQISFTRSTNNFFAMLILTKNGNQDYFYLNGNNTVIPGSAFNVVPGTNGQWVYYRNSMTIGQVPTGTNLLKNTMGKFHLGVINNVGASSEYGYYSAYASLNLSDRSICRGDSVILDGGPYMASYEWNKLIGGTWTLIDTTRFLTITDTGYYACMTNGDFCTLMDTTHISLYPDATVSLGPDQVICEGASTTLDPGPFVFYLWSTGATTRQIVVTTGDTIWVRATNNNGCDAYDTIVITLDSLPKATGPVTGQPVVCQGQNGVTYSVSPQSFASTYTWTLPPGYTGNSTTNTINVDFSLAALSDTIRVRGENVCGQGPEQKIAVTVDPVPGTAGAITGPGTVCQGNTGIVYSIPAVQYATSYTWSMPPGAIIASGAGTNVITVNFALNAVSGVITVFASNNCANSNTSTFPVLVNLFPEPAGPVAGPVTICQGQSGIVYSVPAIIGADSYIWTTPAGTTITAGSGTNTITVTFDSISSASGSFTVKGHSNNCGDGIPSSIAVTVNPLPSPAGPVAGTSPVCQGQSGVSYSIAPLSNASTYIWTIPSGASITSGAGTNSILVSFSGSAVSGLVSVHGQNALCGNGRSSSFAVVVNPQPVPTVTGPASVCLNSQTTYTTEAGKTNYTWTVSAGGTITGGSGTSAVTVLWNTTGVKSITVNYQDANGCMAIVPTSYNVTVNMLPVPSLSGQTSICNNLSAVYTTDAGMSNYSWSVSGGGTITAGGGPSDATATILWSVAGSQTVTVNYFAGTGCTAPAPTVLNIIVKPRPSVTNASSTAVCSGTSITIPVQGTPAGATFIWTATSVSPDISGYHNGNGPVITDVLANSGYTPGDVIYSVTPSLNGCDGNISDFIVTVYPVADVLFTPHGQTLCSGTQTSISLTSNVASPSFSWTASASSPDVTGFGPGNGNSIAQVLTNSGYLVQTVTYNVTPSANGCLGTPDTVNVTVDPVPAVTCQVCNDPVTTITAAPLKLKGGIPNGGTYSGTGVNAGIFYPALAGPGNHSITYRYTNMYGCQSAAFVNIQVVNPLPFACNGILTDVRDNKQYPTVLIGSQCWMAANLNYGTQIASSLYQRDNCLPEKYCFNDIPANCQLQAANYQWDELMSYDPSPGAQGLCPPGWHVPTETEWNTLFLHYISNGFAGAPLKYTGYSGFNALLNGARFLNKSWEFSGFATMIWSSTPHGPYKAWAHGMNTYNPSVSYYPAYRHDAFSVRCLKD